MKSLNKFSFSKTLFASIFYLLIAVIGFGQSKEQTKKVMMILKRNILTFP